MSLVMLGEKSRVFSELGQQMRIFRLIFPPGER
jgi:hypothetical protein